MTKCFAFFRRRSLASAKFFRLAGLCLGLTMTLTHAAQLNISGPGGSVAFGTTVAALPSGNIAVIDPNGLGSNVGAVYLYSTTGTLISALSGSSANDHVGSGGIVVLSNGNFVVLSPQWNNGSATTAGAVTWINGTTGRSGTVSASNSLVGTTTNDQVGINGVIALSNGNYVVISPYWNNGPTTQAGAVTWASGSTGLSGAVSLANSLVGAAAGDLVGVGGVTALSNDNYVVVSPYCANGAVVNAGAVTWANGATGITGAVTVANSLLGASGDDNLSLDGGVFALTNGNYVVASPHWHNVSSNAVGAATWANGSTGLSGTVLSANSLVGTTLGDGVGISVTALTNGNYVVSSRYWNNGSAAQAGAATWGNGTSGLIGTVSTSNSLVGTTTGDQVGVGITALSNGNYVVTSSNWNNGSAAQAGAATWGNGATGLSGSVSSSNSLVGTTTNDQVGVSVTALTNGNYVVASRHWNIGATLEAGAATWANGSTGLSGPVSSLNSLVGITANDQVGTSVTALSNGNYVVASPHWSNGAMSLAGAATWGSGTSGIAGVLSPSNSLVGTTSTDQVSVSGVIALSNGNYVVASPYWTGGVMMGLGAVTWANGTAGLTGAVSMYNSVFGVTPNDNIGLGVSAFSTGDYAIVSPNWDDAASDVGAITLASGSYRLTGTIQPYNSVRGTAGSGGVFQTYSYDASRQRLVVGRPLDNIVSLFTKDIIFADSLE